MSSAILGNLLGGGWATTGGDGEIVVTNPAYFEEYVDTGQVSVNLPTSGWDIHHPCSSFLDSGSPFKEQGLEALRFYTRVKTVAVWSA
jgi:acyl-CoA reductase-like NAD-dependent aldehyde dehydrogenase